jgi:hypothetical protein
MKSIALFISSFLLYSSAVIAQKNDDRSAKKTTSACTNPVQAKTKKSTTYTYTYDFSDFKPSDDCNIVPRHSKDKVFINLTNINRLLYNLEAKGISISQTLPDISIFDSLAGSFKGDAINPAVNAVDPAPSTTTPKLDKSNKLIRIKGVVQVVPTPYYNEKAEIEYQQNYIANNFAAFVSEIEMLQHFIKFGANVPDYVQAECCKQDRLILSILSDAHIAEFDPTIFSVPGSIVPATDYPNLLSSINSTPTQLAKNIILGLKDMKEAKAKADELIASIKKDCKKNKNQNSPECDVESLEDNYPDDFEKAIAEAEKVNVVKITDAASKLSMILHKVNQSQNFVYNMLTPYEIEGETYKAKLIYKPRTEYADKVITDSITIPMLVKGRFKWAIGPSLNFHFGSGLFNETYSIDSARRTTPSGSVVMMDTFNITQNPLRQKLLPYVGVMANFYWQTNNALTPGIAVGLSTSPTQLSDLRAYLGGALIIGGPIKGKLIINLGFAGAAVDRLKPNLTTGNNPKSQIPFTGDKVGTPDQLVEKVFRVGGFFGLSYNLRD